MAQNPRLRASFTQRRCHGLHGSTSSPRQRCHGLHDSATRPQRRCHGFHHSTSSSQQRCHGLHDSTTRPQQRCHGFHARFTHPGGIDGTYMGRAPVIGPTRRILDATARLNARNRSRRRQRFRAALSNSKASNQSAPDTVRVRRPAPHTNKQQSVTREPRTEINDQLTPSSYQPTANSNQPRATSNQPTATSIQPTTTSNQPTANEQHPTANSKERPAISQPPSTAPRIQKRVCARPISRAHTLPTNRREGGRLT